jgi:hypothetical protein
MKIGSDNLLYVLQWARNGKVKRYQLDGTFVDDFTDVGVAQSIGLDWDQAGNLYVSSFNGALVRKFNSNGQDMGLFITTNLVGPTNIWFDDGVDFFPDGNILIGNRRTGSVKMYDSNGNYLEDIRIVLSNVPLCVTLNEQAE